MRFALLIVLTGAAALGGWRTDAPGVRRHLEAKDMAAPATDAALEEATTNNKAEVVPRPADAMPKAPAGFKVEMLATGFNVPSPKLSANCAMVLGPTISTRFEVATLSDSASASASVTDSWYVSS